MDSCSVHRCKQKELTYIKQLRRDVKERDSRRKSEQRKFEAELSKLKEKRRKKLADLKKEVHKLEPKDRRKFRVFRTPSKVIIAKKWSLSTCAQCDFCFEPPKLSASTLQRQTPCLGLDKLIQEERDNQEWNVAFQKALVKRLEASERRITLDDYLGDDDDDGGPRTSRHKKDKKEPVKEKVVKVKEKGKKDKSVNKADEPKEVFKEKKCPCSWKIKREERKRKAFVRIMEREQIKFEKRSLRAQRKYDKERQKSYKRCELTQLAMEKGYFKRNKDGVVDKAEETFSVFIHMDPAQCACGGKAARLVKCKKCFFKWCVWLYVVGFITFFVTSYFLNKF